MYIIPNIIEVKPLENYFIYLKFENGEEKVYDVKKEIKTVKIYEKLKDKKYFKSVTTIGDTVVWKNGEDIAPENLYYESITLDEYKKNNKI
jgi:hypothetical protein